MDRASDYESEGWEFDSFQAQFFCDFPKDFQGQGRTSSRSPKVNFRISIQSKNEVERKFLKDSKEMIILLFYNDLKICCKIVQEIIKSNGPSKKN